MVYTLSGVRLPAVPSVYNKLATNGWSSHGDRTARLSLLLKNTKSDSRMIFSGKSYESNPQLSTATTSEKVLVPGAESEGSFTPTEELEVPATASNDSEACQLENLA